AHPPTTPQELTRVRDAELRAETRNQMVTIPDILTTLTTSIWAEAGGQGSRGRNTSSIRRDLQRLYLARLLQMVVTPEPGMPEDARTVARATLASLSGALGRALVPANELDGYTQAHFAPLRLDRKSTRLNSSHEWISYAVFCLK